MKICVITAARSEYGLLRGLIFELRARKNVELSVLATGSHLEKSYGYTVREIEGDGVEIAARVRICAGDTKFGVLDTMANALSKVGRAVSKIKPDIAVILGDRYESLSIAAACCALGVPIAHIHGGELTYGAFDDAFRHAITKMASLHFAACAQYRKRIIQLGENPKTVFDVGALGVENIRKIPLLSKREIERVAGVAEASKTFLATFHPITTETDSQEAQMRALLDALVRRGGYTSLFTYPNADTGSRRLNALLSRYAKKYPDKIKVVGSLGARNYLSMMKYCAAVVGNSSSGIIEAPSFKRATVNVGSRQDGRVRTPSIIDCKPDAASISRALDTALSADFAAVLAKVKSPYGGKPTAKLIADKLLSETPKLGGKKIFFDL